MKMICILAAILTLALLVGTVCADINFGSVGDNKKITMLPGEAKDLKLSFFNYGGVPLIVEVRKEGSSDIKAAITPKYFILENSQSTINPLGEEEWVVLGENYAKSVPVHITLMVPSNRSNIHSNYHIVKIVAVAMAENEGAGGTKEKISQAREYTYAITVPGKINAPTEEEYVETLEEFYQELGSNASESGEGGFWKIGTKESDEGEEGQERGQLPTGFFSLGGGNEGDFSWFYLVLAVILIVLIYLAYRRFRR